MKTQVSKEELTSIKILNGLDDPNRELVEEMLIRSDLHPMVMLSATHPAEFKKHLQESKPDVILTDCPGKEIALQEVFLMLKPLKNPPPVLIVTSATHELEAIEAVKRGAANYVLVEHLVHLPHAIREIVKISGMEKSHHRTQKQLQLQHSFIEAAFNNTNDLIVLTDTEGRLLVFNKMFADWSTSEHGQEPVAGQLVQRYIHPDTWKVIEPGFAQALQGREIRIQHSYHESDGLHYYETTLHPLIKNDEVVAVASRTHDNTLQINRLNQLSQTTRELQLKNQLDLCFLTPDDDNANLEVLKLLSGALHTQLNLLGFIDKTTGAFAIETIFLQPGTPGELPSGPRSFAPENWRGVWGKALLSETSFIQEGGFHVPEGHPEIKRVLVSPVKYREQLVGLIHLANKPEPFTDDDRQLLDALSGHLAPVFVARLARQEEEKHRLQAERATLESERRLEMLLHNLPGMAYRCFNDPEWTMEFVSAGSLQLLGYPPEALIGNALLSYNSLILPQYRQYLWEKWQNILCRHAVFTDTYQITTATGEIKWVWEQGQGIYDSHGDLLALEGFIVDISEQRENENKVKQSEHKFRLLFESMTQGVVFHNRDGAIVNANPAACVILGLSHEEISGKHSTDPLWQVVHEDGSPFKGEHHPAMVALRTGKTVENVVMGIVNGTTGERKWINVNAVPVKADNEEAFDGVYVTFSDITAMQEASLEIKKARDEAQMANKLKDAFIANISHEIRTPLNALLGFSDLLGEKITGSETTGVQKFVNAINAAGNRLMRSMDLILNYSRTQIGDYPLMPANIDLLRLIEMQMADYRKVAELRKIDLRLKAECQHTTIVADEYSLRVVFDNLIDNAVKYTPAGSVEIKIYCNNLHTCIDISDTGIGMSEPFLEKLFSPYTQEQSGPDRPYEGLGLGLSLTKKLLEYNNASIGVKSSKGKGSVFTITFLNTIPANHNVKWTIENNTKEMDTPHTILVVEDDLSSQYYMEVVLQKRFKPIIVASDVEVFKVLENEPVAMIIMDISLRESTNGLEITKVLKNNPKYAHIPIIAVTAHAFPADKQRSLEAGCNEYLSKPVKKDDLLHIINHYLGPGE